NKVVEQKAKPHRVKRRTDTFKLENITPGQQVQLKEALSQYEDIFAHKSD
ncbi:2649_t:CDS:1, partial [Cetraspora pellucida]